MIMTFRTVMMLLLSTCAVALGLMAIDPAQRIFRRWHKADEEQRYELEKESYLANTVVYIVFAIRVIAVPLYFWTMQSLVPMIPGAMCLWGVFNAVPILCWSALTLKFLFPVLYGGWLILARINNACKRNQLTRNLMGFYIAVMPLLIADCIIDLAIFLNLTPVYVSCCTSAIDLGPRPIPALIMGMAGQTLLLGTFLGLSIAFTIATFLCLRYARVEWISRTISATLAPTTIVAVTEVLTPWILQTPLHHCPFCLLQNTPSTIPFAALFWYALSCPWWALLTKRWGRTDGESEIIEKGVRGTLWITGGATATLGLTTIVVHLAMVFA